tara:strand:- start:989 stop:1114 length:126 start_codon:yes stop_codon:yes gene_type:complete
VPGHATDGQYGSFFIRKVIPDDASVRQWVLSLPYRARFIYA